MPRRSNEFQKLIHLIYQQLAPTASVNESVFLNERLTGTPREVDVLVEGVFAGSPIRLAIECRDHSRPSDIEWIDTLIGKYRDLPVDRVIAVSDSGFSATARDKALANDIEPRTVVDAMDTDWPAELKRLGIGLVTLQVRLTGCRVVTDPVWDDPEEQPTAVSLTDGVVIAFDQLRSRLQAPMQELAASHFFKIAAGPGRTLADIKPYDLAIDFLPDSIDFIDREQRRHRVDRMLVVASLSPTLTAVPVSRRLYGPIGVSSAVLETPRQSFRVTAVQSPDSSNVTALVAKLTLTQAKASTE
jgi:hypothetical protein